MGTLIRHPKTLQEKRRMLAERKLLVEKTLKEVPEGHESYSKLLSESLWLHGVISGIDWALGIGSVDNLFEDLNIGNVHEEGQGPAGSQVRPSDNPQQDSVVPE
jgi:hypothetical protein